MGIKENVKNILDSIPNNITLIAASKTRTSDEIKEVFEAGVINMGENYIKEGINKIEELKDLNIKWHLIGHLQKNKVKKAVKYFDVIQTIDSFELATLIDKEAKKIDKKIDVMVELNVAKEPQKSGALPEEIINVMNQVSKLENINLIGMMTMGPVVDNIEDIRPFFKKAKNIYDKAKLKFKGLQYLSMGMSDSYQIAIEEGSNMIRVGTKIFGPRKYK